MALDVCILNNQLNCCNCTNKYICYFNNSVFAKRMLIHLPGLLSVLFLFTISVDACQDLGNGELYKLHATKDVLLSGNYNQAHHKFLIVGKHPSYEKKRTLIQFENLPSTCSHVHWAIMYLNFHYAHKQSFMSVSRVLTSL